jgi:hypothetical protein
MSNTGTQSKKTTSRKKPTNTIDLETAFDSSEYISNEKSTRQQPRQPKKERSITSQLDEVTFLKE